jgi:hypothetical protein
MTHHKRTEITIQTERIVTIRRRDCSRRWCTQCRCDVSVVDLVQAEALISMGKPRLPDDEKRNLWHAIEDPDGTIFVCLESLLKQ